MPASRISGHRPPYIIVLTLSALLAWAPPLPLLGQDAVGAMFRLRSVLQLPTVSRVDTTAVDHAPFLQLHDLLQSSYPAVHRHLQREVINGYSLVYHWPGSQPDLEPVLFYAHMDVVPVEGEARDRWHYDPFSARVDSGYIWARGALDDKTRIIALMEAAEMLLGSGFQPQRNIYFAFGHDEEVGGWQGAHFIAGHLSEAAGSFACVFDEGPCVVEGVMPGVDKAFALIGMAEKGSLNLELVVRGEGGHSAAPPPETTIGILSKAIARIEADPFPARLLPVVADNLRALAPYLPPKYRFGIKNMGLFKGKILKALAEEPVTDAVIRTKVSPTVMHSGVKYNVLPKVARAVLNIRLLQGDTVESAMARLRKTIDDPRVEMNIIGTPMNPSPVTARDSEMYERLKATIGELFPEAAIAPVLAPAGTDSKHFPVLSANLLRFSPYVLDREEGQRIHGTNERISTETFDTTIRFYQKLIQNVAQ